MIITRTPFRVSLFGGGTDYPQWYLEHGGAVLGMAIDKYCLISVRYLPPFFEHRHRIVYSQIENVRELTEIQHPAVRAVLQETGVERGLEIHHDGDLPARSGLGSSSSFTVGLLNALAALNGRMIAKRDLADEAIRIEQQVIGETVGCQDQVWAAYGGFNRIDFRRDGSYSVKPLIIALARRQALVEHLMLFFTGITRYSSEVAAAAVANIPSNASSLKPMQSLVDDAEAILTDASRDLCDIGRLLDETWRLKRGLAATVSTDHVDAIYTKARQAGALGGKLLGAGGGGFILLFVPPDNRAAVRDSLVGLVEVSFDIDHDGSSIVLYRPEGPGRR
jgi:D-glycero-alpha-D-manno-heptose-7-phosphate kinase